MDNSINTILSSFNQLYVLAIVLAIISGVLAIFAPKIKGFIGEKTIAFFLSRLDPQEYKVINDLLIHTGEKSAQIDHVIVSNYGIFVLETKNYKGWIFGDENSRNWTQVIYKNKNKFYNPILQNKGHVKALQQVLSDYPDLLYIPIVVFSSKCTLKVKTESVVVYSFRILKTIKSWTNKMISDQEKNNIYAKLNKLNLVDKTARKKHVQDIRDQLSKTSNRKSNGCPKCGGELVSRKGKYGAFIGCSNYPKCRYTVNRAN